MKSLRLVALALCWPVFALAQTSLHDRARPADAKPDAKPEVKLEPAKIVPHRFAVLTLLGDGVQLVSLGVTRSEAPLSGEWTATPAGQIDDAALRAVDQAVRASLPQRETKLYTSSTKSLFGDPAALFVDGKLTLPGKLVDGIRQSGAAQLLLVTRNRQEPVLAAALPDRVGTQLDGAGYVLDMRPAAQIGIDGQGGLPIVVPYAFIRVALIDVADMRLRREQSIAVARRLPVLREAAANPWAGLTPVQRLEALSALIEAELPKAVSALLPP